jgi:hypothetical protein
MYTATVITLYSGRSTRPSPSSVSQSDLNVRGRGRAETRSYKKSLIVFKIRGNRIVLLAEPAGL